MTTAADLKPRRKGLVIDLVRAAGVDVSSWADCKGGLAGASRNPKHCYNWSFVQPGEVVVLNLWHDNLDDENGAVVQRNNYRTDAAAQHRGSARRRRALQMDEALQTALREHLPIRVIINDGTMRRNGDPDSPTSKVQLRELDPEIWTITGYNAETGEHVITRGYRPRFVDQFALIDEERRPPERQERSGTTFIRDQRIRLAALIRAGGKCEFCGTEGFRTAGGDIYLETHHIVPLSEGGPDHISNVVALCPNHHREAHYGKDRDALRQRFLSLTSQVLT